MTLKSVRALWAERRGATAVEYALILALVVLAIMGALIAVADENTNVWNNVSDKVQNPR
jgi:pilus assembly protein Flp/PilA